MKKNKSYPKQLLQQYGIGELVVFLVTPTGELGADAQKFLSSVQRQADTRNDATFAMHYVTAELAAICTNALGATLGKTTGAMPLW